MQTNIADQLNICLCALVANPHCGCPEVFRLERISSKFGSFLLHILRLELPGNSIQISQNGHSFKTARVISYVFIFLYICSVVGPAGATLTTQQKEW